MNPLLTDEVKKNRRQQKKEVEAGYLDDCNGELSKVEKLPKEAIMNMYPDLTEHSEALPDDNTLTKAQLMTLAGTTTNTGSGADLSPLVLHKRKEMEEESDEMKSVHSCDDDGDDADEVENEGIAAVDETMRYIKQVCTFV